MNQERLKEILDEHAKWLRTRFTRNVEGSKANLRGADLYEAYLYEADLRGADLHGADLRGANLYGANLYGADLYGADYDERTGAFALQCPEKGAFIGYKKAGRYIVEIQVCEDAKRSSATTRKCRCSKAKVLSITNMDGTKADIEKVASDYSSDFIYKVGETVEVPDFDEDRWNECSTGIHFFITRDEAVRY
ncbi:hypothetical protein B5F53_11565 [Blautia sp. An249]|uniref:pentapeptide repeat-containing protein n=1 Tax=Blautia sp. An249 TaxID=1965603 RepID=UPI000B39423D|nr:pentapeptide repeat-containing protein [Blautia sp. An249]OUO78178.1 hypothetical protein B5F53_11565 [Blautia sp. An249]